MLSQGNTRGLHYAYICFLIYNPNKRLFLSEKTNGEKTFENVTVVTHSVIE